jgi:hypothetical protein
MATTSVFTRYQNQLSKADIEARTDESMKWFMKNLKNINVTPNKILKDASLIPKTRPMPGRMFQFVYDAKYKDQLPYYDKFPLTLIVGPAPGGFYGLNMHYLQPSLRLKLFEKLEEYANNDKYDETTKIKLSYNILNSVKTLKAYAPCFKHYLISQVESKLMMIPSENWEIALFLPTEKFQNADKKKVWRDSKRSIQ